MSAKNITEYVESLADVIADVSDTRSSVETAAAAAGQVSDKNIFIISHTFQQQTLAYNT